MSDAGDGRNSIVGGEPQSGGLIGFGLIKNILLLILGIIIGKVFL
jgi:hypothetical protein